MVFPNIDWTDEMEAAADKVWAELAALYPNGIPHTPNPPDAEPPAALPTATDLAAARKHVQALKPPTTPPA